MRPMIPFIQESIGRAKQYILDLIQIDQKLGEPYCDQLCLLVQHYTILVSTLGLCYTRRLSLIQPSARGEKAASGRVPPDAHPTAGLPQQALIPWKSTGQPLQKEVLLPQQCPPAVWQGAR